MDIYILRGEEQEGPYEEASIKRQLAEGSLAPDTMGWMQGMARWEPLDELFAARRARTMTGMIVDSLRYPLGKWAWIMTVTSAILLTAMMLLELFFGWVFSHVMVTVLTTYTFGYLSAFYFSIISRSAAGERECPDWPDLTDFRNDVLSPSLKVLGATLLAAGPAVALVVMAGWDQSMALAIAACLFAAAGVFYWPFAMIGVVAFGNIRGALPDVVIPAIHRTFPSSMLIGFLHVILLFVGLAALGLLLTIHVAGSVAVIAVLLYLIMAGGRLTGLYYYHKSAAFGWE